LHELLGWFLYTIFGQKVLPESTLGRNSIYGREYSHSIGDYHPELPSRLKLFLKKLLDLSPYSFGFETKKTTLNENNDINDDDYQHQYRHIKDKVSELSPNNTKHPNIKRNLPPLSIQKQVVTILRFLCEILIKILLFTQKVTFQYQYPSDILCGSIISVIIHLFPLDIQTMVQQSPHFGNTHHQSHQSHPISRDNNEQHGIILYHSTYHSEIDRRMKQQLLYFSNSRQDNNALGQDNNILGQDLFGDGSNQINSVFLSSFTDGQRSYQSSKLHQSDQFSVNVHYPFEIKSQQSILTPNHAQNQAENETFHQQWELCNRAIWEDALLPWLSITSFQPSQLNSNKLMNGYGINHENVQLNGVSNTITSKFNQLYCNLIKSNISPLSSLSFYDINLSLLYELKLEKFQKVQQVQKFHTSLQLHDSNYTQESESYPATTTTAQFNQLVDNNGVNLKDKLDYFSPGLQFSSEQSRIYDGFNNGCETGFDHDFHAPNDLAKDINPISADSNPIMNTNHNFQYIHPQTQPQQLHQQSSPVHNLKGRRFSENQQIDPPFPAQKFGDKFEKSGYYQAPQIDDRVRERDRDYNNHHTHQYRLGSHIGMFGDGDDYNNLNSGGGGDDGTTYYSRSGDRGDRGDRGDGDNNANNHVANANSLVRHPSFIPFDDEYHQQKRYYENNNDRFDHTDDLSDPRFDKFE
jgi:hypothetical protein